MNANFQAKMHVKLVLHSNKNIISAQSVLYSRYLVIIPLKLPQKCVIQIEIRDKSDTFCSVDYLMWSVAFKQQ